MLDDVVKMQLESLHGIVYEIESRSLRMTLKNQREAASLEIPVLNRKV